MEFCRKYLFLQIFKKKLSIIIIMWLIAAFLLATRFVAYAGMMINVDVNDRFCVGSSGQHDPSTVVYCNIQDAITDAASDDTINVAAGIYNERLVVDKSLTLLGAQTGVDPTAVGARTVSADESTITYTLPSPNPDVLIEIPNPTTDVTVDGFTLIGAPDNLTTDTTILRAFGSNITVSNNIMDGLCGVLYNSAASNVDGVIIEQNIMTVNKNGVAMFANRSTNIHISENIFLPGTSLFTDPAAIQMTAVDSGVMIANTATGFVGGQGLGGSDLHNLNISRNSFTVNKDAISIFGDSTFLNISKNVLCNNTRHGININGADITITENLIEDNGDTGVNIARDVIDTERVKLECNNISGNANLGVNVAVAILPDIIETIDATNNWWGAFGGQSGLDSGNAVSANVDFTPWLDAPCQPILSPLSCVVSEAPLDNGPAKIKKNCVLPFRAELFDKSSIPVTDVNIFTPPMIQVIFEPETVAVDLTNDALSAGKGTEDNQFFFDFAGSKWRFNLKTRNYTSPGTYKVSMVTGDPNEYIIDPVCMAVFCIE